MRSARWISAFHVAAFATALALASGCSNNDDTPTGPGGGGGGGGTSASFDSGTMVNGASFSFTFPDSGVTNYRCGLHPAQMTGYTVWATPTSAVDSVVVNIISVAGGMSVNDVTIKTGGTVRWVNIDAGMNHSVETF